MRHPTPSREKWLNLKLDETNLLMDFGQLKVHYCSMFKASVKEFITFVINFTLQHYFPERIMPVPNRSVASHATSEAVILSTLIRRSSSPFPRANR